VYVNNLAVGDFMKRKVFAPGARLSWNELTKEATGRELNAEAFAAEFTAN
jgi:Zn-dependent M32 family carboxypeptidase